MNKSDIEECPYCQVELKAEDVTAIPTNVNGESIIGIYITCKFCLGEFMITEHKAPMSKEYVDKKWLGLVPPKAKPKPWGGRKGKKK